MSDLTFNPVARIHHLGSRATRAVILIAAGQKWTPQIVITAGNALTEGSAAAGVRRPWPSLGKRLKVLGATWSLLHKDVKA